MSLERRTRAVARARVPGHVWRRVGIVVGGAAVFAGTSLPSLVVAAAGGFILGWAFQPEADRLYLEGFTDGLATAATLDGEPGQRRVQQLQPSALDDDPGPAPRRARPGQRAAADAGAGLIDLADATGISIEQGHPRPVLTGDGDPVVRAGFGSASFPPIPADAQLGPDAGDE